MKKILFAVLIYCVSFGIAELHAACPVTISAGGPVMFCTGDSVVLTASTGTGYLYQWKNYGSIIAGATSISYAAKTTGNYSVTVTVVSPACSASSGSIYVTAYSAIPVSITDGGTTMCTASSDILQVPYQSGFYFQWFEDNDSLPGTNSSNFVTGHNGTFSCIVTNSCGVFPTAPYVLNDPLFTNDPHGIITADGPTAFCLGGSVQLSEPTGNFVAYQWYKDGVIMPGETGTNIFVTQGGHYRLRLTESCVWSGNLEYYSNGIEVTILPGTIPNPVVTASGPIDFCAGGNVILNSTTGTGWTLQWQNGVEILTGATSSSYNATTSGNFVCQATNTCGTFASNYITVHVFPVTDTIFVTGPATICNGATALLHSTSAGFAGTYQWKLNGVNIPGATSSTYAASVQAAYTCTITNSCGSFTSNIVNIVISGTCSTGLQFDGSNDYVKIPNQAATDFGTGNFTIEAWVNFSSTQFGFAPTIISNRTTYSSGIWIYFAGGRLEVLISGSGIISGPQLLDDACHHIAVSRGSLNSTKVYLDGTLLGTITATTGSVTTGNYYLLGHDPYYVNTSYTAAKARMMEVRLWNISRTQTEIQNSLNTALAGTEPGLVGYYKLDDGSGQVVNDYSSTSNDGQLGSSTSVDSRDPVFAAACALSGCALPTASITAGGATTFCSGGSVTLNANTGAGLSYQWKESAIAIIGATSSSYSATATGNYSCTVTSICGSNTSNSIFVSVNPGPIANITAGGNTTFCTGGFVTLLANTGAGFSYQWQLNGSNIAGATFSSYAAAAAGNYTCVVTSICGSNTSNIIAVVVNPAPPGTITAGGSTTFCTGGSVLLNASTGTGLTYQWKYNGGNVNGATSSTYSATAAGSYACVISNASCSVTSNTITATVNLFPIATITAGGATAFCTGGSVTLNASTATGYSYQWKLNTVNIPNAIGSSYTVTAAGNYSCQVTNSCGGSTSNTIVVTVNTFPTASITATGPTTFCSGSFVTLLAATGTGTGWSFQWRLNGNTIAGATSSSYNAYASGNYSCTISNSCGNVTSGSITVNVLAIPVVPSAISGQSAGLCGNTLVYSVPAVPNATIYSWSLPAGVLINSGQGTTTLSVTYPVPFGSGTVSVNAGNICGTSSASSLPVTSALSATGVITGVSTICEMNTYIYSIPAVSGATGYNWIIPPKARITFGQNTNVVEIKFQKYGGTLTVTPLNACTTSTTSSLTVQLSPNCGHGHVVNHALTAEVFPNPSPEIFTLNILSASDDPCVFILRDITGRELERRKNISPGSALQFGKHLANGIYFAEVLQGDDRTVVRVVKSE